MVMYKILYGTMATMCVKRKWCHLILQP